MSGKRITAAAMSAAIFSLGSALAQTASPPPAPKPVAKTAPPSITDVVVTARRRSEKLEKVPVAVTAISATQLHQRSIFSESDLQTAVPGLTVRQNGSANQFNYALRGQSVDTYSNSPPGVLSYVDEVQIVSHSATSFYDLQGIQVLKGPQGTLFGRNSTGGAVLFQTAKPEDDLSGYIDTRYGSYNGRHVEGAVSIPVNDKISLRLAGNYTGGGAYVYNTESNSNLGDQEVRSVRGTLVVKPIDGLTNTTVLEYTHEGGTNVPTEVYSVYGCGEKFHGVALTSAIGCLFNTSNPTFQSFLKAHPTIYQGGYVGYAQRQSSLGPWAVDENYPSIHRAEHDVVINTTSYDISPDLTVKNIFGYNDSRSDDTYDYDGSPYTIFETGGVPNATGTGFSNVNGYKQQALQFSDELQVQGKALGDRLVYVGGFYYLDERDITDSPVYAYDYTPVAPGVHVRYHAQNEDESEAVFAQGTYKLTDRLNLTGGFRYSWDTISEKELSGSLFGLGPKEESSARDPSWTAGLDYAVTKTFMAYVTTRGSWRAGGYNFSVAPINTTSAQGGNAFLPETTQDVELGVKYAGTELGVPIVFNADIFNQWIYNVQRAAYIVGFAGTGTLVTANVPSAQVRGVEIDSSVRPIPWLNLGGSVVYSDPFYTNGHVDLFGSATNYGPYADTPKWTGTLFGEVSHDLEGNAGTLTLRADVYAQTKMFLSNEGETIAPFSTIPGYGLTNMRLSLSHFSGSRATLSLFVRNMFDQKYYTGGNADGPASGYNTVTLGVRRMLGVELNSSF